MKFGIFIKNGLIVALVLGTAFLSQSVYSRPVGQVVSEKIGENPLFEKASEFAQATISPNLSGGVEKGEEYLISAQTHIAEKKESVEKSFWDNSKKIIAERALSVFGISPEDLLTEDQKIQCQILEKP